MYNGCGQGEQAKDSASPLEEQRGPGDVRREKEGRGRGEQGEQEKHGEEEEDVGAGRRRKALIDNNPATLHPSVGIKPQVHDDASSFPW